VHVRIKKWRCIVALRRCIADALAGCCIYSPSGASYNDAKHPAGTGVYAEQTLSAAS